MPGTADLIDGWKELVQARPGYEEADKYYSGNLGEVFASPRIMWLLKKAGATSVKDFNYAHIPVDTIANRLHVVAVTVVEDTDGNGEPDGADPDKPVSAAQKALDQLMADNQLDAELPGHWKGCSKHGDGLLFVWPVTEGDNEKPVGVDVRVNSADCARAIYDDEDRLKLRYVIKSWQITDVDPVNGKERKRTRANLYYDDRLERFVSVRSADRRSELGDAKAWEPYTADGKPAIIEHNLGRNPFFHFRNDRPYGQPEHLHAYGPQQMVNKLVVADATSVDFQIFPQRYALMDPTADQPMGNLSDPFSPDDEIDDLEDEGNTSQLSADPSAVWKLWAKAVGQFDPAPADVFLSRLDRYVQAMAETTETPLYRFGSHFAQTPSGEALRQADAPTLNRVEARKAAYGPVLADALEFALSLLGYAAEVRVVWRPSQQVTDAEGWNTVAAKIVAGVPRDVALVETGNYTSDQVKGWLSDDADSALIRRVEAFAKLAAAAQQMGAAVGLGMMDRELAARLVQYAAGEMAGEADLADELMTADPPPEPEKGPDPADMMKAVAAQAGQQQQSADDAPQGGSQDPEPPAEPPKPPVPPPPPPAKK